MSEEELIAEIEILNKEIVKIEKKAQPFLEAIENIKKKRIELKGQIRAIGKARRIAERKAWEALEIKLCAFVKNGQWTCGRFVRGKDFCKTHSEGNRVCKNFHCLLGASNDSDFCKKHDPNYEYVITDSYRGYREWRRKDDPAKDDFEEDTNLESNSFEDDFED